jgi:N-acetylglucosamine-6-phosphate deacetylase
MTTRFHNGKIFTGEKFLDNGEVLVLDKKIIQDGAADTRVDLEGGYLVPAFIDIQLYGGGGKLFGEHPSVESLDSTYQYSLQGGAAHILPTVATNSNDIVFAAIEAVRSYWQKGKPGVIGLHLEGPYINKKKKGAHIEQFIRKPTLEDIKEIMKAGKGIVKIMTLAPEMCGDDIIDFLRHEGVTISAGHTDATYEEAMKGFAKIPLATHLYNAMSGLQHRAPGMVGAIFNSNAMASIVADGYHVDFAAISIAKKIMKERLFYITDAVTENKEGYYQHRLDGDRYVVADGTLSGSSLTVLKSVINGYKHADIPLEESLRMGSLYPARAIGVDDKMGMIKEGYQADLTWLDKNLDIKGVYTNGLLFRAF